MIKKSFSNLLKILLRPHGRVSFLSKLNTKPFILDVGCGNNSPYDVKAILSDCVYTGLDINDYRQTKPNLADDYILSSPENFTDTIKLINNKFDAVISTHNLEHCNDRWGTLMAITNVLKDDGLLLLVFPSEKSVNFPSRHGTLNYYDDITHKEFPPDFDKVIKVLSDNNMDIIYANKHYKPIILWLAGLLIEPLSVLNKKIYQGTWAFYGFESVIWARKKKQ